VSLIGETAPVFGGARALVQNLINLAPVLRP
jgi:hypothetical protein